MVQANRSASSCPSSLIHSSTEYSNFTEFDGLQEKQLAQQPFPFGGILENNSISTKYFGLALVNAVMIRK